MAKKDDNINATLNDNDENSNVDAGADLTNEEIANIESTIIVTEKLSDVGTSNVYKIKGTVLFDVIIDIEKDEQKEIRGKIHSDILLGDTKLYQIETWRFSINNLSISNIHCDSTVDELIYDFTAKSFSVKA